MTDALVSLDDIRDASVRIRALARVTPLIEMADVHGDMAPPRPLALKCENLQLSGAFKIRGAANMLLQLPEAVRARGVVTFSSGNHGIAMSLAARILGIPAVVVMPATAPAVKVESVRRLGAEVIFEGTTTIERKARTEAEAASRGLTIVPPFDHAWILAGQGTIGLEILEQAPEVSAIYVPCSGGGLLGGISTAVKHLAPKVRVIGVEPAGAARMSQSLAAGAPVTLDHVSGIADGLLAVRPGDVTFRHIQAYVDEIVTVEDADIVGAVRWVYDHAQMVAEPSGAAAVAAVLARAPAAWSRDGVTTSRTPGGQVVAVISGGNVNATDFGRYISSEARMSQRESLLDRFIRYARIDTQSSDTSTTYPSTEKQKDLLRVLVDDLKAAGLEDAAMDEWGYVMATLPSNIAHRHKAYRKVPTIGLIAHVDTYFGVTGANVQPQVHRNYDGGDIVLSGDPAQVIRVEEETELAACKGLTIVTTDGTTLLGADDKAGVAVILEALWQLKEHPSRLHGPIRVGFTPDEEVGRGTEHFDVNVFAADFAYTIDGSGLGSLEAETFCADTAFVTVTGIDVHPGYAKNKMVNAVRVVAAFLMALPQHRTPETTEGREGFLHPISVTGNTSEAKAQFIVRSFTEEGLAELEAVLRDTAAFMEKRYPRAKVAVEIKPSYRNMRYQLDAEPRVVDYADEAIRRAGLTPVRMPVRGGTDGSRLSFMGLPTPNIFNGSMNFHGKREWVPLEWMEKSVETVLHLTDIWLERSEG